MDRGSRDIQKDIESKNEALDKSYNDLSDESDDDGPIDLTMECVSVKEEPRSDSQETKPEQRSDSQEIKSARNPDGKYRRKKPSEVRFSRQLCEVSEETKRRTANIQERHRMQKMSSALQQLKDCLPDEFKLYNKKLSKIRTLRVAIGYIRALESMLKSAPTPVKREQFPVGTPRVSGPNEAYLAALGTCTPLPFPTPGTNDTMESRYTNPGMYSAYFPGSPYWITEGLQSPATCMMPLPLCYETPNYPTPNLTPASATPRFTPIHGKYQLHKSDGGSHRLSNVAKRLVRSSVYVSPFGDGRNANELNTSFLSAGSEEVAEPDDDGGRERFSNDCCFAMEGVYPLPPDDTPPDHHKGQTGYAGR